MSVVGVSHVAIVMRPENLDAAAAQWSAALGITFDEFDDAESGLRGFMALHAGIELIAPLGPTGRFGPFYTKYLEEHGEGPQAIVLRVDDLDGDRERARSAGCGILPVVEQNRTVPWASRYERFVEQPLAPIAGTHVVIADIVKAHRA